MGPNDHLRKKGLVGTSWKVCFAALSVRCTDARATILAAEYIFEGVLYWYFCSHINECAIPPIVSHLPAA